MTQDEIIEMARQVCDIAIDNRGRHTFVCDEYGLEAFAKLVAQHEREQIAQFIETGYARQFENPWRDDLSAAIRARSNT